MPLYNQLKTINLDNPKPGENKNPPNLFIYATYPAISCHFKSMIQTPDNNFYGVLNFEYGATSPNIFISKNGNFKSTDSYTATAFHITQVIHKSNVLNQLDYNNDLELIIEHTPTSTNTSQNNQPLPNLYVCFFLHFDPNSKYDGDLFLLLTSYLKMDKLVSQTSDFNVNNTAKSSYNIGFDSAIQSLFKPFEKQNAALCTYYVDNQNNNVIIVNESISINAPALNPQDQTSIAYFMQQSKIDQPPTTSILASGTDLRMNSSGAVINVFLKNSLDLPNDQKSAPLSYIEFVKKTKMDASEAKTDKAMSKAGGGGDKNKDDKKPDVDENRSGFTTMEGFIEGATGNFTCRPSTSSGPSSLVNGIKLEATAVGDSGNKTQLMLALFEVVSLIGFSVFIYLYSVKIYVGLYGFIGNVKGIAIWSWILGLALFATGIGLLFSGLFPPTKAEEGTTPPQNLSMTLAGIFVLTNILLYKGSLGKAYTNKEIHSNIPGIDKNEDFRKIFENVIEGEWEGAYGVLKLLIRLFMFPYRAIHIQST